MTHRRANQKTAAIRGRPHYRLLEPGAAPWAQAGQDRPVPSGLAPDKWQVSGDLPSQDIRLDILPQRPPHRDEAPPRGAFCAHGLESASPEACDVGSAIAHISHMRNSRHRVVRKAG